MLATYYKIVLLIFNVGLTDFNIFMKKYTYYLFTCLVLVFISCSSDDSETATDDSALVIGTYSLSEINVNVAQDVDEDGTASNNMLDELDCLNGTLTINADGTWDLDLVELDITSVTGDFYAIRCGRTNNFTGKWTFQSSVLDLNASNFSAMVLNSSVLIEGVNEDLPGVLNRKFVKQ
ncbi:hypothetical protein DFQ03_1487 [Maribacter caenipelagi]|uniref:Lipocalin-like protein n=2 Tax=Maribacter caenipelagi TaxID=1447781 RepID=A0A4R7D8G6_9FLAO|nr:hypothetical protein DFQ03_1487 [Maribacter caenipelagi]